MGARGWGGSGQGEGKELTTGRGGQRRSGRQWVMWCASGIPKGGSHGGRRGGKRSSAVQPLPGCTALLDDQSSLPAGKQL